jgi:hypothetical protein
LRNPVDGLNFKIIIFLSKSKDSSSNWDDFNKPQIPMKTPTQDQTTLV